MVIRAVALFVGDSGFEVGAAIGAGRLLIAPFVAAGYDFGGAIGLGGVADRPEGRQAERIARPGQTAVAVIEMPGLDGFAGMQVDREAGIEQAALAELALGKGQLQRMGNQVGEDRILVEHPVNAVGPVAFEIVAAADVGVDPGLERRALLFQLFGAQDIGEDDISFFLKLVPGVVKTATVQIGGEVRHYCFNLARQVHGLLRNLFISSAYLRFELNSIQILSRAF